MIIQDTLSYLNRNQVLHYFGEPISLPLDPTKLTGDRLAMLSSAYFKQFKTGTPVIIDANGYLQIAEEGGAPIGYIFYGPSGSYLYPNSALASGLAPVINNGAVINVDVKDTMASNTFNAGVLVYVSTNGQFTTTQPTNGVAVGRTLTKNVATDEWARIYLFPVVA